MPAADIPKTHLGGVYVGPPLIRAALFNSLLDGIASNGMLALNETFSVAAAVALRASSMGIALMTSIPSLLGAVSQYFSPLLTHPSKGRKPLVLAGVAGQAFFLFLAALSGWLPASVAPWAFVACFAAATLSTNLTGPFWISWMGDLMPGGTRGRHFAWRSMFFSWMYLCCSLTAGVLSRRFGAANAPWMLFFGVFSAAAALRGISCFFLSRQYEPPTHGVHAAFAPFRFRPGREFSRYCLATGLYQGAASMSGPFFTVWYLRDLHFNYLFVAIALSLTVLGSITFALFWGRLVDAYGAGRVLWVAAFLAALVPIPYVLTANRFVLWASCFYSGASWGGYNLANFNQTLAATDQRHRSHYLAYSSLVVGLIGFAFSLSGGFLATRLPMVASWRLQSLFLLSAALRLILAGAIYRLMRRSTGPIRAQRAPFYHELPGFRLGNGLVRTVARGLSSLNYFSPLAPIARISIMELDSQAVSLNDAIKALNPAVLDMLSAKGKAIFFPKLGILAQSAEANGKEINATIGIALEDDGSPVALPSIVKNLNLPGNDAYTYAPSPGRADLRKLWKEMLGKKNPGLAGRIFSNPVVTSALTHGLSMAGYMFCDPGDTIILPDLFWENYGLIFTHAYGAALDTFPTYSNEGGANSGQGDSGKGRFNVAGLKAKLDAPSKGGKKIVLLNFPNNPSGYTPYPEEVQAIAAAVKAAAERGEKVVMLIDDAYFGLVFEDGVYKQSIFCDLCDLHPNVLAVKIDGATKEDYVWGFRVGFLTYGIKGGTPALYEALEAKTGGAIRGNISNSSNPAQSLLLRSWSSAEYSAEKKQKFNLLKKRYDEVRRILAAHPEYQELFTALPFNSGYFMCIRPKADSEKLRQKLLKDYSTGTINFGGILRLAFSATPTGKLEKLFENVFKASRELAAA